MTMKKIILVLALSLFATSAFAQFNLNTTTERRKNHRGSKKPRKIKRTTH
jgi:hypothetical protein